MGKYVAQFGRSRYLVEQRRGEMKIERYVYPDELYYDQHHAYARVDGDVVVQGVTDLGQALVGEVFFVELPYLGRRVRQGDLLLSIQPMMMLERARRVYATISGEIITVNTALEEDPELVNDNPYDTGWIVCIRPDDPLELQSELDDLLGACDPALKTWARRELAAARMRRPDALPAAVRLRVEEYDFPAELYFDRSHAYARVEGDLVTEGITDLGRELLGEMLFVEPPYVGRKVKQGDRLFSVRPMSPRGRARHICAAVSGEVVAVNESLEENPNWVNHDPYGVGWVAQIRPTAQLDHELSRLMRDATPELLAWVEKELEVEGLHYPIASRGPVEQTIDVPMPRPVMVAPLRLGDIPLVNGAKKSQPSTPKVAGYEFPLDLRYDLSHAYARLEGDLVVEGITDLAQGMLGEVFFIELPPVGRRVSQGDYLLSVQSMETGRPVRRIRAVVSGEIAAINETIAENPVLVNQAPYGEGWMVKISPTDELEAELANLRQADAPALKAWAWEEFERDGPPLEFLRRYLADRVTYNEMERRVYSRDLAPVPDLLVTPLGIRAEPDLIVRPVSTEEIAVVMKHASRHRIPVTPRAAASTVYFDAVPYQNGILLDLNWLRGEPVLTLDKETGRGPSVGPSWTIGCATGDGPCWPIPPAHLRLPSAAGSAQRVMASGASPLAPYTSKSWGPA